MSKKFNYSDAFHRNIGLLTQKQQSTLKKSCVAVFGVGGIGGVITEVLARSGVGKINILDNDKFVIHNLNRQIFCYTNTTGKLKVSATKAMLKKINPQIVVNTFREVTPSSLTAMLKDCDVAILAIDKAKPCIAISRAARKKGISH